MRGQSPTSSTGESQSGCTSVCWSSGADPQSRGPDGPGSDPGSLPAAEECWCPRLLEVPGDDEGVRVLV